MVALSACWHALGAPPDPSCLPLGPRSAPSLLCVLQVKATMYLTYLRAVGTPLCLYALFLFLCQQVASFCRGYWLSLWADDPTVDGQQTHAALRGWVFGLLGCLQGTPLHPPAAAKSASGLPHLHTRAHPLFLNICAMVLAANTDLHP